MPNETRNAARRRQAGFSIVEIMVGIVVLAIALLGHAASTVAEDAMARDGQVRSEALHTVRQLLERMRADDDWQGLYARLTQAQTMAQQSTLTGTFAAGAMRLDDGRWAFDPTVYYPDAVLPRRVQSLRVLCEVPLGVDGLREDLVAPDYDLPADLNGDGTVDALTHNTDYRVLPIRVHAIWHADGLGTRSLQVTTWMGVTR